MELVDGTGQKVIRTKIGIAFVLKGDTSLVQTRDEGLVISYDQDNGEIDLTLFDNPVETFDIYDIDSAIKKFLSLYEKHYKKK